MTAILWALRRSASVGVILCCVFGVACNHKGARQSVLDEEERRLQPTDDLAQQVQSLRYLIFVVSLGKTYPIDSPTTISIVKQGKASVPLLIQALGDTNSYVSVGYAAYCLRKIGAIDGKTAAEKALTRLHEKRDLGRFEDFAEGTLDDYLKSIAPPRKEVTH